MVLGFGKLVGYFQVVWLMWDFGWMGLRSGEVFVMRERGIMAWQGFFGKASVVMMGEGEGFGVVMGGGDDDASGGRC